MSTRHADYRELWVLFALSTLLAARAADLATTLPVLLAQPTAERNPAVHLIVDALGVPGYTAVSLLVAPLLVGLVEGLIELDARYLHSDRQLPAWLVRLVVYGVALAIALAPIPYNIIQLSWVIP